ncbi:DUF308 domain-containing protein [Candidimonas humi]|uniref:DUF308 domain-containing protein n=1 Tax=Candidimonas humi TaxID=683355 RepID=A0ABV8NTP4_9BURK|nr:DUF308 domain-containing protein [Candidimonas humi]MBV6305318.1 DUF308 domain-containing protein [Candidimonas humi]
MVRLVLLLLGVDYLRKRWLGLLAVGVLWILAGAAIVIDALDGVLYFPMGFFAFLLMVEGVATLVSAHSGVGGQRILRYIKGAAVVITALVVMGRHPHGNFVLSMIFGALFLIDGILQAIAAHVVRYPRWRLGMAEAVFEILVAIFFFQPYPTHYAGTVPYFIGMFLMFGGLHMTVLAARARTLPKNPALAGKAQGDGPDGPVSATSPAPASAPTSASTATVAVSDGVAAKQSVDPASQPETAQPQAQAPLAANTDAQPALTVHVWTPTGSSKAPTQRQPIVDRYIAAVDVNGVISTGHAALESPEGIYISLYPGVEIDRSPDDMRKALRATPENDIPGRFLSDYPGEASEWCPSTVRVRIRNYDPDKLRQHWEQSRRNHIYNLTYRNCSSTVAYALEAAIDGALGRAYGPHSGWRTFLRVLGTPELWVAAQIRRRAITMAWTPGLVLDYARAMSLLTSPRASSWWRTARISTMRILARRRKWRRQDDGKSQSGSRA